MTNPIDPQRAAADDFCATLAKARTLFDQEKLTPSSADLVQATRYLSDYHVRRALERIAAALETLGTARPGRP